MTLSASHVIVCEPLPHVRILHLLQLPLQIFLEVFAFGVCRRLNLRGAHIFSDFADARMSIRVFLDKFALFSLFVDVDCIVGVALPRGLLCDELWLLRFANEIID